MPNRIVREGIITSEAVNSLGWPEEVFYRRLLSVVDDYGRFHGNYSLLRAACYPLQLNKVADSDIAKWLGATQKAGLVSVYTVDGKRFVEVLKFEQQVRAKTSKFPHPPPTCEADDTHTQNKCVADAPVVGVVVEDVGGNGSRTNGARHAAVDNSQLLEKLPLREGGDFEVRQSLVVELEPLYPAVDIPTTVREMKAWLLLNTDRRKTRRGIRRFIGNWLQSEQQKHGG